MAEILRKHMSAYRRIHRLSHEQAKAVNAIMQCRTPAMGGVLKRCNNEACQEWEFHFKACKNRHCPQCGAFEKAQWLEAQKKWLLPIHYFHVVFTIDHVFNSLVRFNQKQLFELFIDTAAQLLKEFGHKYLGGEIGFSMVLHTWGQTMQEHPHLHFMVTGGALVTSPTGYQWNPASHDSLFPVLLLSNQFRHRFCFELSKLWAEGKLNTNDGTLDVPTMLQSALSKDWDVYIQKPLYGPEKLIEYLGRYIFRIAISNHRILAVGKDNVSFKYRDNRDEGNEKVMTLHAHEFIRRFLAHILPQGFVRIRHFGLHHSACRTKLQHARRTLGLPFELPTILKLKFLDWFQYITGSTEDPRTCKFCGKGLMLPIREFPPLHGWRLTFVSWLHGFRSWKFAFA